MTTTNRLLVSGCLLLLVSIISTGKLWGQPSAPKVIWQTDFLDKAQQLQSKYGKNKVLPHGYELQCLIALSYYPELKNTSIEFVKKNIDATMAARPKMWSTLQGRKNRKYRIFINTNADRDGLLLSEVSFNAQVGILAHELAHILYYTNKSSWSIVGNGVAYVSKKFRTKFERATDERTIQHGLGWQLHEFTSTTLNSKHVPEDYKAYKKRVYLTPEEIRQQMMELETQK